MSHALPIHHALRRIRSILSIALSILSIQSITIAATGDLLSAHVETNGWILQVKWSGMSTNGVHDYGLGSNNTITGSQRVTVTTTSLSFTTNGSSTTSARTAYATKVLRYPYNASGAHTNLQCFASGSDCVIRYALSAPIFASDSNLLVTITPGLYVASGVTNAGSTNYSASNNSTNVWPKVVGNWSWPYHGSAATNNTLNLRMVGFHASAQSGQPLRAVQFWASAGTNSVTNIITSATCDTTLGDAVPVVEYSANLDISTLAQAATLTVNFKAFPWFGDASSVLDTSDGVNAQPTPLYAPVSVLNDRTGGYGISVAVVATNGVNSTAQCVDSSVWATNTSINAFATIAAAANAIRTNNSTVRGRDDVGRGFVFLKEGNHGWLGASSTYGNKPATYITITRHPDSSITNTIIGYSTGNADISDLIRIVGVSVTSTNTITANAVERLWFDRCDIDQGTASGAAGLHYQCTNVFFTQNRIGYLPQGLRPYSTHAGNCPIARGNWFTNRFDANIFPYTFIGNSREFTNSVGNFVSTEISGRTAPQPVPIVAFNKITGWRSGSGTPPITIDTALTNRIGAAIVQNLVEQVGTVSTVGMSIVADGSSGDPNDNYIIWHNTVAGERSNLCYQDAGSAERPRRFWSIINCALEDGNLKTDTFITSPNAARVGNWSVVYGVWHSGNIWGEVTNIGAPTSFLQEFYGISAIQNTAIQATSYFAFSNRLAYDGAAGAGLGNYALQSTSPAIGRPVDWVLPYDITGAPRTAGDAAGAYTYGTASAARRYLVRRGNRF